MACRSTRPISAVAASLRASTSSDSTSRASRSVSASAACSLGPAAGGTSGSRVSRRRRRAVSGVRSWWEASATNRRCEATRCARRSAMRLNVPARARSSGAPSPASTRRQVAARQPPGGTLQAAHRPGHAAGEHHPHQCDRERARPRTGPRAAATWTTPGRRLPRWGSDLHRAVHDAPGRHRHRRTRAPCPRSRSPGCPSCAGRRAAPRSRGGSRSRAARPPGGRSRRRPRPRRRRPRSGRPCPRSRPARSRSTGRCRPRGRPPPATQPPGRRARCRTRAGRSPGPRTPGPEGTTTASTKAVMVR